jgi:predicted GIY-YIG superfamily endonuclease
MFFVYLLVCLETGRTYVGQTDHLLRRFNAHRAGSTRTTREKLNRPVVAHFEVLCSRAAAMQRERYFKQGAGHREKTEICRRARDEFTSTRL